ncbi:hypothetical protein QBC35DRAFT_516969 [Podospora australis]|uniref:Uncharacterized protein n=1 Tax=Podospora australis TaxID=1536484 RepID=A0AAN6WS59_9PEZI|nr:hypothetical protein QBC35DRAFT_516969 [Podospora australis]
MATIAQPPPVSPLPRLPSKSSVPPPPVTVPRRRPVAAPTVQTTTLSAPAPTSLASPTSPDRMPSPGGSISSLLSAYSNHTSESTPRSSTNSETEITRPKDSYSAASPTDFFEDQIPKAAAPAPTFVKTLSSEQGAQTQELKNQQKFLEDLEELPPPPPLKDAQRNRPETPTSLQIQAAQPSAPTHTASPLGDNISPQDQLWRRRSLKTEEKIDVPELKLVSSHGSTGTVVSTHDSVQSASDVSPSRPLPAPPPREQRDVPQLQQPVASRAAPPPRSAPGGLPGRNIKPVPATEQAVPQREVNMGQEASHLREKLKTKKSNESREGAGDTTAMMSPVKSLPPVSPLSAPRLPTPDYGTNDVKSPLLDTVVSPISPALTPELPSEQKPPPPPAIARKALGAPDSQQLRHAKSSPALAPKPSNQSLGVRSPLGLPSSPGPSRDRDASQGQHPGRPVTRVDEDQRQLSAGNRRDQGPLGLHELQPSPRFYGEPRSRPQSPGPSWSKPPSSETGSEITLRGPPSRPEFLDYPLREPDPNAPDQTDNPGAALFPRNWYTPVAGDGILDARPLANKHFRCITNHRIMTPGKQRNNPIACRTCGHKDRNAECYICSSCHLNVCSGCTGLLRRFRGDLKLVLQEMEDKKVAARDQPAAEPGSATAGFLNDD